eukprot:CAMPEP_0170181624 /NCGR_PEP_ID=MMETSP0040_2-20121228/25597_1 /TAXON_ID=641309 /ORGANISM="Lotharella oceanica, Strain CCMP622" /LENGTH=31 /DNA_ID= /DNA_START= /DNA_END= /DNA_ORIENTATION=
MRSKRAVIHVSNIFNGDDDADDDDDDDDDDD